MRASSRRLPDVDSNQRKDRQPDSRRAHHFCLNTASPALIFDKMIGDTGSRLGSSCRPAFAPWAWLMLVVVLLSAAPLNGQPRTRLVGSAFDPASVSVVVRPGKARLHLTASSLEKRRLPDTETVGAPFHAILEKLDLAARPLSAAEPRTEVVPRTPLAPRRSWRAHLSQAPPAL